MAEVQRQQSGSRQASVHDREQDSHQVDSPQRARPSFTPVNQEATIFAPVNNLQRTQSQDLDNEPVYDLLADFVSVSSTTKRRKLNLSKPIQTSGASGTVLPQAEKRNACPYPKPIQLPHPFTNTNSLNFSTPLDSKKENKALRTINGSQTQRFLDLAITKPHHRRPEWTTTQDSVKAAAGGFLAKTTTERLASFRYRGSRIEDVNLDSESNPVAKHGKATANINNENRLASELAEGYAIPPSYQPIRSSFNEQGAKQENEALVQKTSFENEAFELVPEEILHGSRRSPFDPTVENSLPPLHPNTPALVDTIDHEAQQICNAMVGVKNDSKTFAYLKTLNQACQTQDSCSWGLDISVDGTDSTMIDTAKLSEEQQPNFVAQPYASLEDEFPLDKDVEAELINLFVRGQQQPVSRSQATTSFYDDKYPLDKEHKADLAYLPMAFTSLEIMTPPLSSVPESTDGSASSLISTPIPFDNKMFSYTDHSCQDLGNQNHTTTSVLRNGFIEVQPQVMLSESQCNNHLVSSSDAGHETILSTRVGTADLEPVHNCSPLKPFARPDFPAGVRDRSQVPGVSANVVLRTCFRIGEAIRASIACDKLGQDVVIELFARITESSRETGKTKQYFQFADLFHDRPPFPSGVIDNFNVCALQETESRSLLGKEALGQMIRCIGRLKRDPRGQGWTIHISNVRSTDWEEIRWTKRIAGAGMTKT